jgi:hypothetical protein
VLAAGLLASLLFSAPGLIRVTTRRRRLSGRGAPADRLVRAWHELHDTLWDLGMASPLPETPRQTVRRISREAALDKATTAALSRLAGGIERLHYAPVYARAHEPAGDPAADVAYVRAGLMTAIDRRVQVRAILLPPSTLRRIAGATARARERRAAAAARVRFLLMDRLRARYSKA